MTVIENETMLTNDNSRFTLFPLKHHDLMYAFRAHHQSPPSGVEARTLAPKPPGPEGILGDRYSYVMIK